MITKKTAISKKNAISKKKIYITGSVQGYNKKQLQNLVESNGGIWANISKSLDYLVLGQKAGPAKIQKAQNYGIKTIPIEEFLELIKRE